MLALREFRSTVKGLPDLLNHAVMVQPGVIMGKDGSFMTSFYFMGNDMASSTVNELEAVSVQVNAALVRLGTGWMIHVDSIRVPATTYPDESRSAFPDPTTYVIEAERRAQHAQEGAHFDNIYSITFTYLCPADSQEKFNKFFLDDTTDKSAAGDGGSAHLRYFDGKVTELVNSLSSQLKMRQMNSDELLTFVHHCLTGLSHTVRMPSIPMYLDSILGSKDFYTGQLPRIGKKHIRVISIMGFPGETMPGVLDLLNHLPIQYRWSSRFIPMDQFDAESRLSKFRRNWFQKRHGLMGLVKSAMSGGGEGWTNTDAVQMSVDADTAINENSQGLVRFGYYTASIIVMNDDAKQADINAAEVAKVLGNAGFPSNIEKENAVEAFLGSIPGHGYQNVRRPLMHTLNLADLLPLTAVWSGNPTNPCPFYPRNSPPLLYAATTGATPFRLSLHVGDLGHTMVIGPPGAGKSTLLGLIMMQHFRYPNAQVFCFDKGNSAFVAAHACGGSHYEIGGDNAGLAFCPLAELDTPADRAWAKEYIEMLVALQLPDGSNLGPTQRDQINVAIERLAESTTSSDQRTMTDFIYTLQNSELKDALNYYASGGTLGSLLDAKHDSLRGGRFQVFEMDHIMGQGERALVPILMYLFHVIEKRLDGRPTLVVLDEAWVMLKHPLFKEKIGEWLRTMRKMNAAVVFATQSLGDVTKSSLNDAILNSVATKILLANPEANTENMRPIYESIGLNERQVQNISMATPKRDYYLHSTAGRRMINLGLGSVALSFVGASGKEDIARARQLIEQYGDEWPAHWMRERGVPEDWVNYWLKARQKMQA